MIKDQTRKHDTSSIKKDFQKSFSGETKWGNLWTIKTKSGKTIHDFRIQKKYLELYTEIIVLSLRSESMTDEECQYWFTLFEKMNKDQIKKYHNILYTERVNIDAINKKYAKKKKTKLTKEEILARNSIKKQQEKIREKEESQYEVQDEKVADNLLDELNNL